MTEDDRQELQSLRDEVTKLKSAVCSLSFIGVTILLFAGIPFVMNIFVFEKDWDVASAQVFGSVAVAGLVQIPLIYWYLFKAGLLAKPKPQRGDLPRPGATPRVSG